MLHSAVHNFAIFTGKSALILESLNPQYDERLFIEFPEKYKFTTYYVQIVFWMSKQKQKQKTNYVHNMFWECTELVIQWTIFCRIVG